MPSDWKDNEVGYGRPPAWTRFEKGKSGNLKGRPRKAKPEPQPTILGPTDKALRQALDLEVPGGASGKSTLLEVITKSQVKKALAGDVRAQRDVLKESRALELREAQAAAEEAARLEQERQDQAKQELKTYYHYVRLKVIQKREWDTALAAGKSEPDNPWPHPDDIIIDERRQKVWVRGPIDTDDLLLYQRTRTDRDFHFARCVLSLRKKDRGMLFKVDQMVWPRIDAMLPLRWQIKDCVYERVCDYLDLSVPEMLEHVEQLELESRAYWKMPFSIDRERDRKVHRELDKDFRPLLRKLGYNSVVHLWRETGVSL